MPSTSTTRTRTKLTATASAVIALSWLLTACGTPTAAVTSTPSPNTTTGQVAYNGKSYAFTPQQLRDAYGITPLYNKGFTGKGQTVVLIESFGSPQLHIDANTFASHFKLPTPDLTELAPLGTTPFDPNSQDQIGWATETTEDVDIVHALAPDAKIVVLVSPVDETEGTIGLPQFRKLIQYALDNHLGTIISQSFGASEYTLNDAQGKAEIQNWTTLLQNATTKQHVTFIASSGDNGATDYADLTMKHLVSSPTTSFPNDEPWVTSVGGTTLFPAGSGYARIAWSDSGGGRSAFFSEPSYQQALPTSVQKELNGQRGVPDVAAAANPNTGLAIDVFGTWNIASGTSAGSPTWAAIVAIADQMAQRPIGFINPALYKIGTSSHAAQDFYDVTQGNNNVQQGGVSVTGYQATQGWDPVTGFGAPNAANLVPDLIADTAGN